MCKNFHNVSNRYDNHHLTFFFHLMDQCGTTLTPSSNLDPGETHQASRKITDFQKHILTITSSVNLNIFQFKINHFPQKKTPGREKYLRSMGTSYPSIVIIIH